jgi:AIPR protein
VRSELKQRYKKLFQYYDDGLVELLFVTNHRRNDKQYESVKGYGVQIFHLNDMLQFVVDYIEDAMPRTPTLELTDISSVLSADKSETKVPTSIVFARLVDLIRYMEDDPYGRLFARNIRLVLKKSKVNPEIKDTFQREPTEFVFSNNGITMLCEGHSHDPGTQVVRIENPRVVNGSQTLHSIRHVSNPSPNARAMIRIIQVKPPGTGDFSADAEKRRDIIHKISIRSNLQNPIRKWNLVANDEYQHGLARFFRKKKLYYERRAGEYSERATELKSVGIQRGPNVTVLTQLIASYFWDFRQLGPVAAKGNLADLFGDDVYSYIRKASPELAYQLYLLDWILHWCVKELATHTQYAADLESYGRFALFTMCSRALKAQGAPFGESRFSSLLERELQKPTTASWRVWKAFCKAGLASIWSAYKEYVKHQKKQTRQEPSLANFTKTQEYLGRTVKGPLPKSFQQLAGKLMKGLMP